MENDEPDAEQHVKTSAGGEDKVILEVSVDSIDGDQKHDKITE